MNSISLYTLTSQFTALSQLDTEGELDATALQAITDTLDGLSGEIEVKATNVGAFCLNLEAYAEAAKEASKALSARAARIQRRADVMREYLRTSMEACGIKKIDSTQFTLTRKTNPPRIVIAPEAEVPPQYLQPPNPRIELALTAARAIPINVDNEGTLILTEAQFVACVSDAFPPREPDKKALAVALKAGVLIDGVTSEQGERLEIKP